MREAPLAPVPMVRDARPPGGARSSPRGIGFGWRLRRSAHLAAVRRRNRHAGRRIFIELVAQRADRDAEDVRRMSAVAEAVLERLEDQVALDLRHGAAGGDPK